MTLEQQVANLVTATTDLTSVVNGELQSIRAENITFKQSTLDALDVIITTKIRNTGFTIYVDPNGLNSPVDPINNNSSPFNTIASAVAFLSGYYWATGFVTIKLSAGTHFALNTIEIDHICSIKIEGASTPVLSGVDAIVSQTTLANKDSASSVAGSNANLFNYLASAFQSHVVTTDYVNAFNINGNFILKNCFVYFQGKQVNTSIINTGITVTHDAQINNCAFMYFHYGILATNMVNLLDYVISSGNVHSLVSADKGGIYSNGGSRIFSSGNFNSGLSNTAPFGVLMNYKCIANGGNGISCYYNTKLQIFNCTSQNNGGYGYFVHDAGLISTVNSDALTTGNLAGKKFEQNTLQGYVIGINAT